MSQSLLPSERQRRILETLEQKGVVRNAELTLKLNVTAGTIRSDLRELQNKGLLEIVHGGAVTRRSFHDTKLPIDDRLKMYAKQKQRIGKYTAQLLQNDQTLIVDSGTTTLELINHIPPELNYLQVITHDLTLALTAARLPNVEVLMPGGMVRSLNFALVGPQAIAFLDTINANISILATNGFSSAYGVTNANLLDVEVKRKIADRAEKVIVVTDSSKYGKHQTHTVRMLDEVDMLITDTDLPDDATQEIESFGVEVIRV